jgi:hypothetical protein
VIVKFEVSRRHVLRPTFFIHMVPEVLRWERPKRCYGKKKVGVHGKELLLL